MTELDKFKIEEELLERERIENRIENYFLLFLMSILLIMVISMIVYVCFW